MLACVFYFCLIHVLCLSNEIYDNFHNGWIPTSSDKVNNLLRGSFVKYATTDYNGEAVHVLNDYKKVINRETEYKNEFSSHQTGSENNIKCKEDKRNCKVTNEGNGKQQSYYFTPNEHQDNLESSDNTNPSNTNKLRRAKVISEDLNSNMILKNTKIKLETTDGKDLPNKKEEPVKKNKNTYEVTELNEIDTLSPEQAATELGYQYQLPKVEANLRGNNLTNSFLSILTKYNIGIDDNLSNYDLSLRNTNNGNFLKDQVAYSPVKLPYRYNSLNHLPVNPLLAVILSNYGYYLPGLYGIQTNYNNLYGYLASNNIHNNKPFGLYKVFSDADSSNK